MEKAYFPDRLQPVFSEIVRKVRKTLKPEYIILAGSFSKSSWLYNGDKLLSDIEIVFVCKTKWSKKIKNNIVRELNEEFPYKIELKGFRKCGIEKKVLSNYSFSNPGYLSLNFFDIFSEIKYLYKGEADDLNINLSIEEVPAWEAWRLYVNRMADFLKSTRKTQGSEMEQRYYLMKILESTADAYLLVNHIYQKEISFRLDVFKKELLETDIELDQICKDSWNLINEALKARYENDLSDFNFSMSHQEIQILINAWMRYFETQVANEEHFSFRSKINFYEEYFKTKKLQRKYLDVTNGLNIELNNLLKLLSNRSLINREFKWYGFQKSWRHHILVIMASLFYEDGIGRNEFHSTRAFAKGIFKTDYLNALDSDGFKKEMIKYWQIVR